MGVGVAAAAAVCTRPAQDSTNNQLLSPPSRVNGTRAETKLAVDYLTLSTRAHAERGRMRTLAGSAGGREADFKCVCLSRVQMRRGVEMRRVVVCGGHTSPSGGVGMCCV